MQRRAPVDGDRLAERLAGEVAEPAIVVVRLRRDLGRTRRDDRQGGERGEETAGHVASRVPPYYAPARGHLDRHHARGAPCALRRPPRAHRGEGLSGVVLFDHYYVLYYAGFAFVPTERPIAFVARRRRSARARRTAPRGRARAGSLDARPRRALRRVSGRPARGDRARTHARRAGPDRDDRRRPGRLPLDPRLPRPDLSSSRAPRSSGSSRRSRSRWRSSPRPRST